MLLEENWDEVKRLFGKSFRSSLHYAIATVNENGEPHVTPIGSLILAETGRGFYFEEFARQLPANLQKNRQICILAVNSNRWFWIKSLFLGKFSAPPAIRLFGSVGEVRKADQQEVDLWHRRVRKVRFSKGFAILWRNMRWVRDIEFSRVEPVYMGEMTRDVWKVLSSSEGSAE